MNKCEIGKQETSISTKVTSHLTTWEFCHQETLILYSNPNPTNLNVNPNPNSNPNPKLASVGWG